MQNSTSFFYYILQIGLTYSLIPLKMVKVRWIILTYEQTKLWIVDKSEQNLQNKDEIKEAALWIKNGRIVAFPTETVYGLGANATSDVAVEKIFAAKGRPSDNPLIVHVASIQQVQQLATHIPEVAAKLMESFWPGPLTIVLQSSGKVSQYVTANLPTVAIRMPDHPVALALLQQAEVPVAAPSANRSGKPSPTQAIHVLQDLTGKIHGVIDAGPTGVGVESTVIDCTTDIPTILRPGGITKEDIERVIGRVNIDPSLNDEELTPKSPGQKYLHYAPNAPLILVSANEEEIRSLLMEEKKKNQKIGVLTTDENVHVWDEADVIISCGTRKDLKTVAQNLYDSLRQFDEANVDMIFAETYPKEGIGQAIMNRLEKAAQNRKSFSGK